MGIIVWTIILSLLFGYLGTIIYPTIGIICSISIVGAIIVYQLKEIRKEICEEREKNEEN